ncbi:MAG: 2,3-epoxybenzoyl-CoA dihydrolase [Alphaproteobacteria bacterium]
MIEFSTHPDNYRHWRLSIDGRVATLALDVAEDGGLEPGYQLKLNSYDLSVDIELYDAVQRLRFEHPEVGAVVLTSAKERVFCAGANIGMLGLSSHEAKVNFCKFTNETRNGIEDASAHSGQRYLCVINGPCAGGGYELALATDYILLVDDGSSAVSLPEVPLLAVLPGTGGLTRLVDKRHVRRDRADYFCTTTEGLRGRRALDWHLVDELSPRSRLAHATQARAQEFAGQSDRPADGKGVVLRPLAKKIDENGILYDCLRVELERSQGLARIIVQAPTEAPPQELAAIHGAGVDFWPLALARALDDAILHLRFNEPELGTWVLSSEGSADNVRLADEALLAHQSDWFVREITLYLKRSFKRLDVSSRSLVALIEPGSCFMGTLFELVLAADRSFMLDGCFEDSNEAPAEIGLTAMNLGVLPMVNGLSRLESRFFGDDVGLAAAQEQVGKSLEAEEADALGLVTFAPDDIDWEDEVRVALEGRAGYSPDALSGMEANLRFVGPETVESKIFSRLSAWQNWIFQRPNAVGDEGALKLFGTGKQARFDRKRV